MIDDVSVYKARLRMGEKLAAKITREWSDHDIDVVIPIPDTSRHIALPISHALNVKYREGLIKNRYIGRTFIMPGQELRKKSVRRKLNAINLEFRDRNILLVDDDPALRGMLGFSLESVGYIVTEAESRKEAIDCLTQKKYSIVLLDMGMPPYEHSPQEGVAVLEWLQLNQSTVKTLVLTGQNAESTSYLALKHGAFDFLEKPVSSEDMLSAIKRAVMFYEQEEKLREQEGLHKVQIDVCLGDGVKHIRNQAEEKLVRQVLSDTEFNVHEAARRLGLKRENVYYLIKKYGLHRDE